MASQEPDVTRTFAGDGQNSTTKLFLDARCAAEKWKEDKEEEEIIQSTMNDGFKHYPPRIAFLSIIPINATPNQHGTSNN